MWVIVSVFHYVKLERDTREVNHSINIHLALLMTNLLHLPSLLYTSNRWLSLQELRKKVTLLAVKFLEGKSAI